MAAAQELAPGVEKRTIAASGSQQSQPAMRLRLHQGRTPIHRRRPVGQAAALWPKSSSAYR